MTTVEYLEARLQELNRHRPRTIQGRIGLVAAMTELKLCISALRANAPEGEAA